MIRSILAMAAALVLASCASNTPEGALIGQSMGPPDPVQLAPAGASASYRVGAKDVLDITVFQVPEMTRVAQVDAAGQINLPLIGSFMAAGSTTDELQVSLAAKLQERYFQSPEVTIFVKEYASQKITVEGAVGAPGVYPLTGRTTLLQVMAVAKGVSREANERQVVVFRTINGQRSAALFDLKAIRSGKMIDPEIYGNDIVVVERSGMRTVMRSVTGALPIMGLFRPFF